MPRYTPIRQWELDVLGLVARFTPPAWAGPALPRPEGEAGLAELLDTANRLIARAQYLIQAKDGLSTTYTIQGITATAERFMLGTEEQVQQAADLRGLLVLIESFFEKTGLEAELKSKLSGDLHALRSRLDVRFGLRPPAPAPAPPVGTDGTPAPSTPAAAAPPDYSAFALEDPSQYSMAWTTFEDAFRNGFPHVPEYVAALTDPDVATRQFWPVLRSTALPYNLLVLQKLDSGTVGPYQANFGAAWTAEYDQLVAGGRLYGIDMTIFADLTPYTLTNETVRFTPSTMALLKMDDAKNVTPIAVYVADPQNAAAARVFTPGQPAWIYALLAIKTSLTVHGIWLGHVYTLHIVTAAMQMTMWNTLPPTHVIHQLLAPQSQFTIAFDLTLLLAFPNLSPPTSISDSGKFLTLCNRFAATHDFHSTDPRVTLSALKLDVADFTDPSQPGGDWNLYPNVQWILRVWDMTQEYVSAVVNAGYADDAAVAADTELAAWISASIDPGGGNVVGLTRPETRDALTQVLTSLLYRIVFHGMGRLRSMGTPLPSFAPNYPPCLQSPGIPAPGDNVGIQDLLRTWLPRTGTLGALISFYDIFSFNAPYVPLVPNEGPEAEPFFDDEQYPGANEALVRFRKKVEEVIRTLQPDWVQIGQWPRNIEL
ncbi:MAG TPA: hypothetical protein VHG93_09805 [Longimicrobium sp.]|nr:hypothetical protein [Longimicrobium sp.]